MVVDLSGPHRFSRSFRGSRVRWRKLNLKLIHSIFDHREYNPDPSMQITDHSIVIDAGAHVGTFTIFAALQNPHGRVYSLEPNDELHALLAENLRINGLTHAQPIHAALAHYDGVAKLYRGARGTQSDTIAHRSAAVVTEVPVISMNTLLERYDIPFVDFLKLDLEGAEYQLFSGDLAWLGKVRRIAMEIHPLAGHDPLAVVEMIRRAGFAVEVRQKGRHERYRVLYAIKNTRRPADWARPEGGGEPGVASRARSGPR